ncbi:MAG: enoyl-CoA hydratase-related protein [Porticoccaceae bacterium]
MSKTLPPEEFPICEIDGALATITFNRPSKFNALHPDCIPALRDFLVDVESNPDIRCLLLKGNGKHFMAGGDLSLIVDFHQLDPAQKALWGESPPREFIYLIRIMMRMKKPIVASVQGGVAGAALGLISACDFVIAANNSFYWAAHVLHGGTADGCISWFLPRNIGLRKAKEMAMLGDRIYAQEAKELGLINFVVEESELQAKTTELVQRLCKGPTVAYGLIKQVYHVSLQNTLEEQGALEADVYGNQALQTNDASEGLMAFFEKREANFSGR